MAHINISFRKFHFLPRWSLWSGGGGSRGGYPPLLLWYTGILILSLGWMCWKRGGGGGKMCVRKMAGRMFPIVNFCFSHDGHFGLLGGGGSAGGSSNGQPAPQIQRRNPNNSAEQFGGPIFRRNASQSPGLWPWPPKHTVPLVAVLSDFMVPI